jgi:hypothetical protein
MNDLYTSYELEALAVVKARKKFQLYLLGIPFKVIINYRAFMAIMNKKNLYARSAIGFTSGRV